MLRKPCERRFSAAWIRASVLLLVALLAEVGGLHGAPPDTALEDDWYPADISPPPGTRYPCALTALPRGLPGIPEGDRRFINHVYTLILRETQAKLVLQKALAEGQGPGLAIALARYRRTTEDALAKIRAEPLPSGLESFTADVIAAIALQRSAFEQAVKARLDGKPAGEEYRAPEGRTASRRLIGAWHKMMRRYPDLPPDMRDSVYHHLCALDLF